jgi:hypothetical protein
LRCQQEVRTGGHIVDNVKDAGGTDEPPDRNRVARVVLKIFAGYPVHRRVEVRAGVLAEPQRVPVPARPLLVVAGNDVDRHARRCGKHRRQADDRGGRAERLREIDDLHAAGVQCVDELMQQHFLTPQLTDVGVRTGHGDITIIVSFVKGRGRDVFSF